jgi:hypothetical protein
VQLMAISQILQLLREKSLVTMRSEKPLNFGDLSKGMFNGGICEFESYDPSQPVPSLGAMFRSQKFTRHSRELSRR